MVKYFSFERGNFVVYSHGRRGSIFEISFGADIRERFFWFSIGLFGCVLNLQYEDMEWDDE